MRSTDKRRNASASSAKSKDVVLNAFAAAIFSISLGVLGVGIPLLALHVGYDAAQIGLLIALTALSQLVTRLFMGAMMRRLPDKVFIVAGAFLIAVSCGLVAVSTTLLAFLLSQLAQGIARAFFFTGSQTHAVRISDSAVRAIMVVLLPAGVGGFIGPALAGVLFELSPQLTMAIGAGIGVVGMIPALLLIHLPPFESISHEKGDRVLKRPGVRDGISMGVVAGVWKGLLDSYVPVVLNLASQSASTIGFLVAAGNAALVIGTGIAGYVRRLGVRGSLLLGITAAALGVAALGPLAGIAVAAAAALTLSGLGAGVLQTVGPAVASNSVHPQEKGDAITAVGLFRAAALFIAPMGMAGIVIVLPVGAAFVVAGALMMVPSALSFRPGARQPSRETEEPTTG